MAISSPTAARDAAQADEQVKTGHDPKAAHPRAGQHADDEQQGDRGGHVDDLRDRDGGGDRTLVDALAVQVPTVDRDVTHRRRHGDSYEGAGELHPEAAEQRQPLGHEGGKVERCAEVGDERSDHRHDEPARGHRPERPEEVDL